jgi:GATA-binding protein
MTSSPISSGSSEPSPASSQQLAHQLAAKTLLTMVPSKSPDTPTEAKRALPGTTSAASTPSAPTASTSTPASVPAPALSNAMDVDTPESRGIKRKNGEDEPRFWSGASLSLDRLGDRERLLSKDRLSRSPLASADPKPAQPLPQAQPHGTSRLGSNASPGLAASSTANRYSIYSPMARESALSVSPWGALTATRYGSPGIRGDISPAVSTASTTTPAATTATATAAAAAEPLYRPRRASPETTLLDSRLYPSASLGGYGHYGMGQRQLQEHQEQLREGKRWLDIMLAKTEKMLLMVENKMALTGEPIGATTSTTTSTTAGAGSSTIATAESTGRRPGQSTEDWEYEERERARTKVIQRLDEERERDRAEKDRREKERREKEMRLGPSPAVLDWAALERERESQRDRERLERETARERERLSAIYDRGRDTDKIGHIGLNPLSALSSFARDRSEIERNRYHILASRRISAISRAQSTNAAKSRTVGAAGTGGASGTAVKTEGTAASSAGAGAAAAGAKDGAATAGSSAGTGTGAAGTAASARKSPWDGDPIMAGIAMPRRDQGALARGLGRGLWSFDVRG